MTIERLGPVDPVSKPSKSAKIEKSAKAEQKDSINLSAEAKNMGEIYRATELAKSAPDVRLEKVEEIKKKLQDPNYINDRLLNAVADELMKNFGL